MHSSNAIFVFVEITSSSVASCCDDGVVTKGVTYCACND